MANLDAPKGFRPVRYLNGSPYNGATMQVAMLAADATATYIGDVVKAGAASGVTGVFINGQDTEGMPTAVRVTAGTTGQDILGVVVGFLPDPTNLGLKYRAASTNRIALITPAQGLVYEVQEDADTTPLAAVDMNLNISFTTTAGSTTTGFSGMELDSSAKATTVTLPLRLLGLVKRPDNLFNTAGSGSDNAKFEVVFNTYNFAPNTVGIA
jgi:hypothetical protein